MMQRWGWPHDLGVIVAVAGLSWAALAWGQSYQVVDLGTFVPKAINDKGSLAGSIWPGRAARWRAGQALEDFGGLMAVAMGISPTDVAVGYGYFGDHWSDPVRWRKDGTRLDWPVPEGANFARASAINRRGWGCGMAEIPIGSSHAALFNNQTILLPDYAEGLRGAASERPSWCEAISGANWVVGTATAPDHHLHAMLWDSPTTFRDLHDTSPLGDDPSASSWACCITEDNDSAGTVHDSTGMHAWRWVKGPVEILADLPGLGSCQALGMTLAGEVVGACGVNAGVEPHAVLWDINGTPIDLNALTILPAGWTLAFAQAINNDGDIACIYHVAGDVDQFGRPRDHGCLLEQLLNVAGR